MCLIVICMALRNKRGAQKNKLTFAEFLCIRVPRCLDTDGLAVQEIVTLSPMGGFLLDGNLNHRLEHMKVVYTPTGARRNVVPLTVFEEHFKVLESLESYLETQNLAGATAEDNDESGISTSPSIHEVVDCWS